MEPKKIVVIGVGGQGNLLATNLLGEAALTLGMPVLPVRYTAWHNAEELWNQLFYWATSAAP